MQVPRVAGCHVTTVHRAPRCTRRPASGSALFPERTGDLAEVAGERHDVGADADEAVAEVDRRLKRLKGGDRAGELAVALRGRRDRLGLLPEI